MVNFITGLFLSWLFFLKGYFFWTGRIEFESFLFKFSLKWDIVRPCRSSSSRDIAENVLTTFAQAIRGDVRRAPPRRAVSAQSPYQPTRIPGKQSSSTTYLLAMRGTFSKEE